MEKEPDKTWNAKILWMEHKIVRQSRNIVQVFPGKWACGGPAYRLIFSASAYMIVRKHCQFVRHKADNRISQGIPAVLIKTYTTGL